MYIQSNSIEGDKFLHAMKQYELEQKEYAEQFSEFIRILGYKYWHIHDGWVCNLDGESGQKVRGLSEITLTVIPSHIDSHNITQQLQIGDRVIIVDGDYITGLISNSTRQKTENGFTILIYEVVKPCPLLLPTSPKYELQLKESKILCYQTDQYNSYTPPKREKFLVLIMNKLRNFLKIF